MTQLKLEVGKFYRTSNGYKVRIDAILPEDNPANWPVLGTAFSKTTEFFSCTRNGKGSTNFLGYLISEWGEQRKGEMWVTESKTNPSSLIPCPGNFRGSDYFGPAFKIKWEEILE